jgi:glycosyltransferase involved in cell wall biosynthesis
MELDPEISVLMAVYNEPENWLCESIDSILSQSFAGFEFIIVNDNPDSEINKRVLEKYSLSDPRVKIISNQQNKGLTKSLNIGIEVAKGKYLARMDADDVATPNRFAVQRAFLEGKTDYVACGSIAFKVLEDTKTNTLLHKPFTDEDVRSYLFFECPIIHSTLFLRRLNNEFLRYDESFRYSQDYDYIVRLADFGKINNFKEPLLYYRISSTQVTAKNLVQQNQLGHKVRSKNVTDYLSKNYNIDLASYQSTNDAIVEILHLIKKKPNDKVNLSAILYTIIFYSKLQGYGKIKNILKSQFFMEIGLKHRMKLLLSIFKEFNEQKLIT